MEKKYPNLIKDQGKNFKDKLCLTKNISIYKRKIEKKFLKIKYTKKNFFNLCCKKKRENIAVEY